MKVLSAPEADGSHVPVVELELADDVQPCEFCSGTAVELLETSPAVYLIYCTGCGAQVQGRPGAELLPQVTDPDRSAAVHMAAARDALRRWNADDNRSLGPWLDEAAAGQLAQAPAPLPE